VDLSCRGSDGVDQGVRPGARARLRAWKRASESADRAWISSAKPSALSAIPSSLVRSSLPLANQVPSFTPSEKRAHLRLAFTVRNGRLILRDGAGPAREYRRAQER
jgi:hypothetical protein